MHCQLFLIATPNMELPWEIQLSVVELSCKLIFYHKKTLPSGSHISITMAFHYPDGNGKVSLVLTAFILPSLPVLISLPANSWLALLKKRVTLLC